MLKKLFATGLLVTAIAVMPAMAQARVWHHHWHHHHVWHHHHH